MVGPNPFSCWVPVPQFCDRLPPSESTPLVEQQRVLPLRPAPSLAAIRHTGSVSYTEYARGRRPSLVPDLQRWTGGAGSTTSMRFRMRPSRRRPRVQVRILNSRRRQLKHKMQPTTENGVNLPSAGCTLYLLIECSRIAVLEFSDTYHDTQNFRMSMTLQLQLRAIALPCS